MLSGIPIPKDAVRPSETVLVNITPQETRVAVLEENNICELHIERNSGHSLVGNIYLGVVKRVLPGMQSAFIDIGLERAAFLHIVDVLEQRRNPDETQRIEHMLFEGQSVLVQVIKDPINTKGARLSTQISLAGRFLVHLPQEDHIGISQRIEDDAERSSLRERLNNLLPENACHGYIIRTNAENASDDQLQSDINYLTKVWEHIQKQAKIQPPETLLYQDLPLSLRVLRDMFSLDTHKILVDSTENHRRMTQFAEQYVQGALGRIELFKGERPLFETHNIEQEIARALQPRVNLNFGSYLIIESTEAMTTIDVNTGGFVGARNFDETIFRTNLEACHTIARELRLRNLGGIIIIDFIDRTLPFLPRPGPSENAANRVLRNPTRNRPRSAPLRCPSLPHFGRSECHRLVPRRRITIAGDVDRLYRQTDFAGSRNRLHAGTIRYCVALKIKGRLKTFQTAFSADGVQFFTVGNFQT